MPRATAHRLASALERHLLVSRDAAGRFVLGPGLVRLGRVAGGSAGRSLVDVGSPGTGRAPRPDRRKRPALRALGDTRVCLASLESPHSLRTIVAVGAVLPMDRGSAAKVLAGDPPCLEQGWAESVEERERGVASVSAPVVVDGCVVAAVSVSGPIERTTRQPGRRYGKAVAAAARALATALAEPGSPALETLDAAPGPTRPGRGPGLGRRGTRTRTRS